ncbi:Calx-beta domain-containing protein, partial [Thiolapillus sp.]|uniref:Calx-beta domain-containing protein n=2 Tax=Thiolapillus sp. TaxID=2017437 RepID=UPI0025E369C4
VRPRGYWGLPAFASLSMAGSGGPRMSVDLSTASSSSGVFGFREAAISVGEGAGSVSIAISRTGGNAGAVSVLCSTSNGSALAGKDFSSRSTRLNWPAGDSSDRNCTVPILDDSIIEGRQRFTVTLSSATGGAVLGTPDTLAVTIRDDETCSGDSVQLNSIAFETGADVDCLATTSIQATGSAVSTGSRVGFFAPGVTLGPDFAVSGTLTVGTFEVTDSSNTTPLTGSSAAAPFNPYPSIIALSGISGSIHWMTVTLMGVNHT